MTPLLSCHQCQTVVVSESQGRVNYRGSDIGSYPDTGKVTGKCPRCQKRWEFVLTSSSLTTKHNLAILQSNK